MESSTGLAQAPARHDTGAIRLAQIGCLIAAAGELMVVFGLLPKVGRVMTVVVEVLAARVGLGHTWHTVLAAGAALEIIARLLAESSETLGGWLAVAASVIILCAVALGYPSADRSRT